MKNVIQANINQKKARTTKHPYPQKGPHISVKRTLCWEDIIIKNIYAPNNVTYKYIKVLIDLQGKVGKFTVVVGNINTPLLETDKAERTKASI